MSKIKVNQLELRNFFSYGDQWQTIDFESGVNMILGHDKDKERSNGAGKTSFLEAIPFALFGQTSKGVALPKIINWKNGKQCEVKIHFEKDGLPYIIHRGIKPSKLEFWKDGVHQPKLSDKRVFQQELEQDLIGMDFKAAEALLFQNANNMISIFNTPKPEKRKFIEKFFNQVLYSKVGELTNIKLSNLAKRLSEIDLEIGFKRGRIGELEIAIKSLSVPNMSEFEGRIEEAEKELAKFIEDHTAILSDGESLVLVIEEDKAKLVELKGERREFIDRVREFDGSINTLEGEEATLLRRFNAIGDISEQKEKYKKVKAAIDGMVGLEEQSKTLRDEIAVLRESINEKKVLLRSATENKRGLLARIKEWDDYVVTGEGECPTCFQTVDVDHILSHVQNEVRELKHNVKLYDDSITAIEKEIKDVTAEMDEKSSALAEVDAKLEKKRKLETHLATLSQYEEKERELGELQRRLGEIDEQLEELRDKKLNADADLEQLNMEITEVSEKIDEKQHKVSEYTELKNKKVRLEDNITSTREVYNIQQESYNRIMGEHEVNIASKAQLETEIEGFGAETNKLNRMKDYLEYIKLTTRDEHVKQYSISNIVPFLQQQTNHYLGETGHNYYVELDNWLDGTIKGYGVGDCDFGNMSGGEGKSIDFALKFAMMDVARRQAGSYMDVLVLDELLDSSIDSFGIEKTFDIIRMKQREDDLKVFVVSHREEVADFGVDRVYKVEKEDGFSTITKC